jgi:hypothetical protein
MRDAERKFDTHAVNITASETWAGGGVTHRIPNTIFIDAPATVTVQPCAIVELSIGASIYVRGDTIGRTTGALVAAGADDETGFVTFRAADRASAWGGLLATNPKGFIDLHHTRLVNGGDLGNFGNASLAADGAGNPTAIPMVRLDHVEIDNPRGAGVYLNASAAFTADSNELTVVGAKDHPILLTTMALGTIPTFAGRNNARDDALLIPPNEIVSADMTIHKRLPILFKTASVQVGGPNPVSLTLDAGVVLRFDPLDGSPGALVQFGNNGLQSQTVGVLVAQGTATDPIVFTSGAATPVPGDWQGIWLANAAGSILDHLVIEYAGGANGIDSPNCRPAGTGEEGALIVGEPGYFLSEYVPPPNVFANSTIRRSAGFGINAIWSTTSFTPNLTGNGNAFTDNAGCAQTYNALSGRGCPSLGCQPQE